MDKLCLSGGRPGALCRTLFGEMSQCRIETFRAGRVTGKILAEAAQGIFPVNAPAAWARASRAPGPVRDAAPVITVVHATEATISHRYHSDVRARAHGQRTRRRDRVPPRRLAGLDRAAGLAGLRKQACQASKAGG
jgi:hypothetical protein